MIDSYPQIAPSAPKPPLNLDLIKEQMPCHTDPAPTAMIGYDNVTGNATPLNSMTVPRRNGNGIEGHLCIATKDSTGYFLGPVPYMAKAAMELVLNDP